MFNILNTDSGDPFHVFALQCNILYIFYLGSSMEVLVGEITAHEALTVVGHVMQLPKKCYWTQFFILFLSLLEINLFINLSSSHGSEEKMTGAGNSVLPWLSVNCVRYWNDSFVMTSL